MKDLKSRKEITTEDFWTVEKYWYNYTGLVDQTPDDIEYRQYFTCNCSSKEHTLELSVYLYKMDKDDLKYGFFPYFPYEISFCWMSAPDGRRTPFFDRLKRAWCYLFNQENQLYNGILSLDIENYIQFEKAIKETSNIVNKHLEQYKEK